MEKTYSVILLTNSGDFMLETEEQIELQEYGVKAEKPYIINENEEAQKVRAEKVFVPYHSLDNIQYGDFKHETVQ